MAFLSSSSSGSSQSSRRSRNRNGHAVLDLTGGVEGLTVNHPARWVVGPFCVVHRTGGNLDGCHRAFQLNIFGNRGSRGTPPRFSLTLQST